MGKMLVAARDLEEGTTLAASDLAAKSPANGGLPPYELDRVVGRALARSLREDEPLTEADLGP